MSSDGQFGFAGRVLADYSNVLEGKSLIAGFGPYGLCARSIKKEFESNETLLFSYAQFFR